MSSAWYIESSMFQHWLDIVELDLLGRESHNLQLLLQLAWYLLAIKDMIDSLPLVEYLGCYLANICSRFNILEYAVLIWHVARLICLMVNGETSRQTLGLLRYEFLGLL